MCFNAFNTTQSFPYHNSTHSIFKNVYGFPHVSEASKYQTFAFQLNRDKEICEQRENVFLRFSLGGVVSLLADDDTLVLHTGRGSFSNGSPNLIVRNVPSGSQRTLLPHLSFLG